MQTCDTDGLERSLHPLPGNMNLNRNVISRLHLNLSFDILVSKYVIENTWQTRDTKTACTYGKTEKGPLAFPLPSSLFKSDFQMETKNFGCNSIIVCYSKQNLTYERTADGNVT